MVIVFFVSAVFHELVLGVPLHMVRLWAFAGIMLQVSSTSGGCGMLRIVWSQRRDGMVGSGK